MYERNRDLGFYNQRLVIYMCMVNVHTSYLLFKISYNSTVWLIRGEVNFYNSPPL